MKYRKEARKWKNFSRPSLYFLASAVACACVCVDGLLSAIREWCMSWVLDGDLGFIVVLEKPMRCPCADSIILIFANWVIRRGTKFCYATACCYSGCCRCHTSYCGNAVASIRLPNMRNDQYVYACRRKGESMALIFRLRVSVYDNLTILLFGNWVICELPVCMYVCRWAHIIIRAFAFLSKARCVLLIFSVARGSSVDFFAGYVFHLPHTPLNAWKTRNHCARSLWLCGEHKTRIECQREGACSSWVYFADAYFIVAGRYVDIQF